MLSGEIRNADSVPLWETEQFFPRFPQNQPLVFSGVMGIVPPHCRLGETGDERSGYDVAWASAALPEEKTRARKQLGRG